MYFAGLDIHGGHVGLYYMPVYVDATLGKDFHPRFMDMLRGKSCFHLKALDADLEKQIEEALEKGFEMYKEKGWVNRL